MSLMQPLDMHFVSFQTCKKDDFCLIFRATLSVLEQNYDPCSLSSSHLCRMQTYCHPFRLSDYPKDENQINVGRMFGRSPWQPSYRSVLQFSLAPLSVPLFWFIFPWSSIASQEPRPGKMFYMAAVTNAGATVSSTSLVGLFLLSECAWPTRVAPPLTSCHKFVWSSLCYQKHCIIPSTNGKWTFQLIRYTYVSGMYAMNTSFTCRPVLGFSLEIFCIFCCRTPINR